MDIQDITFEIRGRILRIAAVKDESDLDIPNPLAVIDRLKAQSPSKIDIFTFGQRIPETVPKYQFPMEWDSIAALDYKDHKYWFEKILDDKTRNMIRAKKGAVRVDFDDALIKGIVEIYNETPVRQGRPFRHYGKPFDDVKRANATHLDRSVFIGAYHGSELIGFLKLVYGDRTGRAEQIISKIAHRDKAPTNALLDEAVKLCEAHAVPYLLYGIWPAKESFAHFKKNNGFKEYRLPRYFVPLSAKGKIGLRLGWHKELRERAPRFILTGLRGLRERWYEITNKSG
jgi:hypothetical protein